MEAKHRILLGAIGGITPYVVTLLAINYKTVIPNFETADWVGFLVRCAVLVFLGSLVAYLHTKETEPFKVFQLGLSAPALIAAALNANPGLNQKIPTPIPVNEAQGALSEIPRVFFSEAFAQGENTTFINKGMLKNREVSNSSRFLRGLLGTKISENKNKTWYVVVGSHGTLEAAKDQAEQLRAKGYETRIYKEPGNPTSYAVVIASNVTREEAEVVKKKAITNGLPEDAYVIQLF